MLIERNNFLYHLEQDRSSHSIGRNIDGGWGWTMIYIYSALFSQTANNTLMFICHCWISLVIYFRFDRN